MGKVMAREYLMRRSGKPSAKVVGDLIAEVTGTTYKEPKDPRWYDLALYQKESTKELVLHIAYRHNGMHHDYDWDMVEKFQDPKALVEFLTKFNPIEHSLGWPPESKWDKAREFDQKKLRGIFANMVSDLLQNEIFVESI